LNLPIYEYRCDECGYEFEVMQKFSDSPISNCAKCEGVVSKLISQSTFHLKGTGWYATDYAKKSTSEPTETKAKVADSKPTEDKKD
jgi:putative FmdB family regulatory protein